MNNADKELIRIFYFCRKKEKIYYVMADVIGSFFATKNFFHHFFIYMKLYRKKYTLFFSSYKGKKIYPFRNNDVIFRILNFV